MALSALAGLQIEHLAKRYYPELSGGEKQLVLIARAIAQQAKLLVMDEPTASLDFGNQIRVLEKIKQLQAQNIALLITTHNPQQAMYFSGKYFTARSEIRLPTRRTRIPFDLRKLSKNLPHFCVTISSTFEFLRAVLFDRPLL